MQARELKEEGVHLEGDLKLSSDKTPVIEEEELHLTAVLAEPDKKIPDLDETMATMSTENLTTTLDDCDKQIAVSDSAKIKESENAKLQDEMSSSEKKEAGKCSQVTHECEEESQRLTSTSVAQRPDVCVPDVVRSCRGSSVSVRSSGDLFPRSPCSIVAGGGCGGPWYSTNEPNSWIHFDFGNKSIQLSHYVVRTFSLIEWVVEGWSPGGQWVTLDQRNTLELKGTDVGKRFDCNSRSSQFFRVIQLRQIGKNSTIDDRLILSQIELFGSVQ
jgi:hypothetical protein